MPRFQGELVQGGRFGGELIEPTEPVQVPEDDSTFMQRQEDIVKERQDFVQEGISKFAAQPSVGTAKELIMDVAGAGAGAAFDTVGNAIVTGVTQVAEQAPDQLKDAVDQGFQTFINAIPSEVKVALGTATENTTEKYAELEKKHPTIMRQLENTANVLFALTPAKQGDVAAKPTVLGQQAAKLSRKAKIQKSSTQREGILELITPKATKQADVVKDVARTREGGLTRAQTRIPFPEEKSIARDVSRVPGVDTKRSFIHNSNKITDEKNKLVQKLSTELNALPEPKTFLLQDASNGIDDAMKVLLEKEPFLRESPKLVSNIVSKAKSIVSSTDNSAAGIWEARKEFDRWIKDQVGKFPDKAGALKQTNDTVRDSLNKVIFDNSGGVKTQRLFRNISNLNKAEVNLAPKVRDQASTAFKRVVANLSDILGARNKTLLAVAALTGSTVLAASSMATAPIGAAISGAIAVKGIHKAMTSPQFKQVLSELIKTTDEGIKAATSSQMRKQLRLDRAALIELSEQMNKEQGAGE